MLNQIRRPFFKYRKLANTPSPSNVHAAVVGSGTMTLDGSLPMGEYDAAAGLASKDCAGNAVDALPSKIEGETVSAFATLNMQRDNPATHKVAANRLLRVFFIFFVQLN
jgi:hypothetical protein